MTLHTVSVYMIRLDVHWRSGDKELVSRSVTLPVQNIIIPTQFTNTMVLSSRDSQPFKTYIARIRNPL